MYKCPFKSELVRGENKESISSLNIIKDSKRIPPKGMFSPLEELL